MAAFVTLEVRLADIFTSPSSATKAISDTNKELPPMNKNKHYLSIKPISWATIVSPSGFG